MGNYQGDQHSESLAGTLQCSLTPTLRRLHATSHAGILIAWDRRLELGGIHPIPMAQCLRRTLRYLSVRSGGARPSIYSPYVMIRKISQCSSSFVIATCRTTRRRKVHYGSVLCVAAAARLA